MKAVVCRKQDLVPESLQVEETASPRAAEGQVVIEVFAAGVNFADSLMIQGKYQAKLPLPFTPGLEVSGVVKEIGRGVAGFEIGERVVAFPGMGGYAEEVAVSASLTFSIPNEMTFSTAAAFFVAYGTSHHALRNCAKLQPGETILILGAAGGVGLACVDVARAMGANVIAAASGAAKLQLCTATGAHHIINYGTENLKEAVKSITSGRGVDVVYDPVGGTFAESAVRALAKNGRYLVIGFASGEIPKIPLNLLLVKRSSIIGVFWGDWLQEAPDENRDNLKELFDWFCKGKLTPNAVTLYPLHQAGHALTQICERKVEGRIVLVLNDSASSAHP